MEVIETTEDIMRGMDALAARDAAMAGVIARTGVPPLRRREAGFAALAQIICGQQVSTASAAAIWARLEAAGLTEGAAVLAGGEEALRACGLSRPKIRYMLAIAARDLDFAALSGLPDEAVVAALVALPGIGRWSAEIYALTALGRRDIFPAGDLALQEAARLLYRLDARPDESRLRHMAGAWAPWRAVAARLLWGYYRVELKREGLQ